jgi:hypothetical protein
MSRRRWRHARAPPHRQRQSTSRSHPQRRRGDRTNARQRPFRRSKNPRNACEAATNWLHKLENGEQGLRLAGEQRYELQHCCSGSEQSFSRGEKFCAQEGWRISQKSFGTSCTALNHERAARDEEFGRHEAAVLDAQTASRHTIRAGALAERALKARVERIHLRMSEISHRPRNDPGSPRTKTASPAVDEPRSNGCDVPVGRSGGSLTNDAF